MHSKLILSRFSCIVSKSLRSHPLRRSIFTIPDKATYDKERDAMAMTPDQFRVFQFSAEWCQPCQRIKPQVDVLSQKYPQFTFSRIDVDRIEGSMDDYGITSVPTFLFLKGNQVLERVEGEKYEVYQSLLRYARSVGGNLQHLEDKLKQFYP